MQFFLCKFFSLFSSHTLLKENYNNIKSLKGWGRGLQWPPDYTLSESGMEISRDLLSMHRGEHDSSSIQSGISNVLYRYIPLYRGSVHPLQDVALRITSPVVSLSGISAPSDSFHLHDVVSPSLRLSTSSQ